MKSELESFESPVDFEYFLNHLHPVDCFSENEVEYTGLRISPILSYFLYNYLCYISSTLGGLYPHHPRKQSLG